MTKATKTDAPRCVDTVRGSDRGGLWSRRPQCTRKALPGSDRCAIHHPDAVAKRRAASDAASRERLDGMMLDVKARLVGLAVIALTYEEKLALPQSVRVALWGKAE